MIALSVSYQAGQIQPISVSLSADMARRLERDLYYLTLSSPLEPKERTAVEELQRALQWGLERHGA